MSRQPTYSLLRETYRNPKRGVEPHNPPAAYPDERQELGSDVIWRRFWRKVGECQVRCALEGEPSTRTPKWCRKATPASSNSFDVFGALHFIIQFKPDRKTLLHSVSVRITIESLFDTPPPTVIYEWAPKIPIPGPEFSRQVSETCNRVPQLNVTAPIGGGGVGGVGNIRTTEFNMTKSWSLSTVVPTTPEGGQTIIEYMWACGWDGDDEGARMRPFKTSLITRQRNTDDLHPIVFLVEVQAESTVSWRRCIQPPARRSKPISPIHNTDWTEFDKIIKELDTEVRKANMDASPTFDVTSAVARVPSKGP